MTETRSRLELKSQADKFREAARELETDEREDAFDRVVRKIAKAPKKDDGSDCKD